MAGMIETPRPWRTKFLTASIEPRLVEHARLETRPAAGVVICAVRLYDAAGKHELLGGQFAQIEREASGEAMSHRRATMRRYSVPSGVTSRICGEPGAVTTAKSNGALLDRVLQLEVAALDDLHPHSRVVLVELGQHAGHEVGRHRGVAAQADLAHLGPHVLPEKADGLVGAGAARPAPAAERAPRRR